MVTIESKRKLPRCKYCTDNGNPFLIRDLIKGRSYIYCEACNDDIVFFNTTTEAMLAYHEKYKQVPPPKVEPIIESISVEEPIVVQVKEKRTKTRKKNSVIS